MKALVELTSSINNDTTRNKQDDLDSVQVPVKAHPKHVTSMQDTRHTKVVNSVTGHK